MPKNYDTNPLNNDFADRAQEQFGQTARPTQPPSEMNTQNLYEESQTRRFNPQTPPNNQPSAPYFPENLPNQHGQQNSNQQHFGQHQQQGAPPNFGQPNFNQPPYGQQNQSHQTNYGQPNFGQQYQTPPNPNFTNNQNNFNNYGNFNQQQYNGQMFGGQKNGVSAKAAEHRTPPTMRTVNGIGLPENIVSIISYLPYGFGIFASLAVLFLSARSETRVRFHAAQALTMHFLWVISIMTLELIDDFISLAGLLNNLVQYGFILLMIFACVRVWQGKSFHIQQLDDVTDWLESKIYINRT